VTEETGDQGAGVAAGSMIRDVVVYTLARLALVVVLTVVILFAGRLLGIAEFPLVVAMLFAILISLPLGLWLLAPLRNRATAGIAAVDRRRRLDRERLEARLRGEEPPADQPDAPA
jgi:antibiotic biosynthesis monooxygenase (ABM) superfamily enzyme